MGCIPSKTSAQVHEHNGSVAESNPSTIRKSWGSKRERRARKTRERCPSPVVEGDVPPWVEKDRRPVFVVRQDGHGHFLGDDR
jgi:hypothetical protein